MLFRSEWDEERLRQELLTLIGTGLSRSQACRQLAERSGQGRRALYALLHQGDVPEDGGGLGPDEHQPEVMDPGAGSADRAPMAIRPEPQPPLTGQTEG